jgi:hypothetical protein
MFQSPITPAPTLEEALAKVAADNNFTSVSVGRMPVGDRIVWTASVHFDGHARDGICCAQGCSRDSIREALHDAIVQAAANRAPLAIMPPALPALNMAEAA